MKLITQKILQELQEADIYAGYNMDSPVIVKYFNPYGVGTWLVVAGERLPKGDWNLYGYHHIGSWEWGFVRLSELEAMEFPMFHGKIERDLYRTGTVKELCR